MSRGKNNRLLPPEASPEQAMESVLRQITRGRSLPPSFVTIARGLFLLDSPQNQESMAAVLQRQRILEKQAGDAKEKGVGHNATAGFRAQELRQQKEVDRANESAQERKELRSWAEKRGCAKVKATATLQALMDKCKMSSPSWRRVVLSHLRSVDNPHKVCRNLGAVTGALIGQLEIIKDAEDVHTEEEKKSGADSTDICHPDKGKGLDFSDKLLPPGKSGPTVALPNNVNTLCSAVRRIVIDPQSPSVADRGTQRASSERQGTPSINEIAGGHSSPSTHARPASPVAEGRRRHVTKACFPDKKRALRVGVDGIGGRVSGGGGAGDETPSVPEYDFATAGRRSSWMARMKQRIRSSSADPSARRRPKAVKFSPSPVGFGWRRGLKKGEGDIKKRVSEAQNVYDSVTKAMDRLDENKTERTFEETKMAAIGDLQDMIQALQQSPSTDDNSHDLQGVALEIIRELLKWVTSVENSTFREVRDHCAAVAAILTHVSVEDLSLCWPSEAEIGVDFTWGSGVRMVVFRPSKATNSRVRGAGAGSQQGIWCIGNRWPFWGCACRYASKPIAQSSIPTAPC